MLKGSYKGVAHNIHLTALIVKCHHLHSANILVGKACTFLYFSAEVFLSTCFISQVLSNFDVEDNFWNFPTFSMERMFTVYTIFFIPYNLYLVQELYTKFK